MKTKILKSSLLIAFGYVLFAATAIAQTDSTIVLQQGISGYTGCGDTYLDDGSSHYYENYGIDNDPNDWTKYRDIKVRYSSGSYDQWDSLIKFDLSGLPSNWNITSASLSLYYYDDSVMSSGDWLNVAVWPLMVDWDAGSGPHNGDDRSGAAWEYRKARPDDSGWYNAGARGRGHDTDVDYDAVQTLTHNGFGWVTWDGTEVTNTVRDWYSGSRANDGWAVDNYGSSDTTNGVLFHSADYSISPPDYQWRPKLTINYTVIPEPGTLSLLVLAALGFLLWHGNRKE
ncbi:MAG: DNRLRE domain-containing protein [Thermoguttaceae bacterium]